MKETVFEPRSAATWILPAFGVAAVIASSMATWMWLSGRGSPEVAVLGRFGLALLVSVVACIYLVRRAVAFRSISDLLRIDHAGLSGSTLGGRFWTRSIPFSVPWQELADTQVRSDRYSEYVEILDTAGLRVSVPVASIRPQKGLDGQALLDTIRTHRQHWTGGKAG